VKFVKEYAKKRKLKVVELSRYPWEVFRHKTILDAGIEDFLSLIANAEVVFSNSFHAVCFSLLFEKEFYAFSRKTGRKIEDICNVVGLDNRFITSNGYICTEKINWEDINKNLDNCRQHSLRFIERNIVSDIAGG